MLGELETAIDAGDWPEALARALDAWRATRAPALADLIDALGAKCPPVVPPRRLQHEWWVQTAATYDPLAVHTLAAMAHDRLARADGTWDEMRARHPAEDAVLDRLVATAVARTKQRTYTREPYGLPSHQRNRMERLAAVARWPADPRVATVLACWLAGDQFRWDFPYDAATDTYLEILAEQLVAIGDVRVLPALSAVAERPRAPTPEACALQARLVGEIAARMPVPVAVDDKVARWVAELAPIRIAPRERDLRALWREVARDPDALAPRMVLADALLDQGDRRGELIVLQCSTVETDALRARSLLAAHYTQWLGDLALVFRPRTTTFERGILVTATVDAYRVPEWVYGSVGDHRELLAIETLWPGYKLNPAHYATFLDRMEQLPARVQTTLEILDALAARRPTWPFRCVHVSVGPADPELAIVVDRLARQMPDVEELGVGITGEDDTLLALVPELPRRFPKLRAVKLMAGWQYNRLPPATREALDRLAESLPFVILEKR